MAAGLRAAGAGAGGTLCAVCKLLRRRCSPACVFTPFFPAGEPPSASSSAYCSLLQEVEATIINGNKTEAGHIIVTTIGGRDGKDHSALCSRKCTSSSGGAEAGIGGCRRQQQRRSRGGDQRL